MHRLMIGIAALTTLLSFPASAQDVDPVGRYVFQVDYQGQLVSGTFEITGEPGKWTGLSSSEVGSQEIRTVEVDGNTILLTIVSAELGEIVIEMIMDGDAFTGFGTMGYEQFQISGTKER